MGFQRRSPKNVGLFNGCKTIKRLTVALKKLYSLPKKLHHFITNLFFVANIPTPGQVWYHVEKNLVSSCLCSWPIGVTEIYLPLQYYTCTEVYTHKVQKNKSAVTCTYRQIKNSFASKCFFSFKIKQQDLII